MGLLDGKVALITGAGSGGFGREMAIAFASKGANIVIKRMDIEGRHRNQTYAQTKNDWVFSLDADERPTEELKQEILRRDFTDKIVTIRLFGSLSSGKTYDLKSHEIIQMVKDNGAYEVLINKNALTTVEYKSVSVSVGESNEEIEAILIKEHASKVKLSKFKPSEIEKKIFLFLNTIGTERQIGTKVMDYNDSILKVFSTLFKIQESKE